MRAAALNTGHGFPTGLFGVSLAARPSIGSHVPVSPQPATPCRHRSPSDTGPSTPGIVAGVFLFSRALPSRQIGNPADGDGGDRRSPVAPSDGDAAPHERVLSSPALPQRLSDLYHYRGLAVCFGLAGLADRSAGRTSFGNLQDSFLRYDWLVGTLPKVVNLDRYGGLGGLTG